MVLDHLEDPTEISLQESKATIAIIHSLRNPIQVATDCTLLVEESELRINMVTIKLE